MESELPLVSIIIPVHNAEKTLERCMDSVLEQDYKNIDVILVDDGSGDNSFGICMRYALSDSRVRVIHKKQSGVSETRNIGMDRARGRYLQFVDSDDWMTPDAVRQMVEAAETTGCDLVISHFYRVKGRKIREKGHIREWELLDRRGFAEHMMEKPANFYYGVMWNKLYRRSILEEHHIRCDKNLSWCEDFLLNLQYLCFAETICAQPCPVYYYVKSKNSLVSQGISVKSTIEMKQFVFRYYKALYEEIDMYEENKRKIKGFFVAIAQDGR